MKKRIKKEKNISLTKQYNEFRAELNIKQNKHVLRVSREEGPTEIVMM